jgi:hypothetical protein
MTPAPSTAPVPSPAAAEGPQRDERIERQFAYQEAVRPHRRTIDRLETLAKNKSAAQSPEDALALHADFESLGDFARSCETTYATVKKIPGVPSRDQPEVVCPLVARRAELGRMMLEAAAPRFAERELESVKQGIENLQLARNMDDVALDDLIALVADPSAKIAELRARVAPLYAKLGTYVPADLFGGFTTLKSELAAALDASVSKVSIRDAEGRDARAEQETRAIFKGVHVNKKAAQVVAVRAASRDWTVFSHQSSGIPLYRTKVVLALVKVPGDRFCRLYPTEVRQGYTGGGTWQAHVKAEVIRGPQVASCKS